MLQQISPEHPLCDVYALVAHDFDAVNRCIMQQLSSDVPLINKIDDHIFKAGGKRLRPLLVLLAARACGYEQDAHIKLAAIIEFLHTATLLHDDVVDVSTLRRGRATANHVWGNASSVLVGDFIYSRAFEMMVQLNNMDIMRILASATNVIAAGEVMQLAGIRNTGLAIAQYMDVIYRKTARLFEASAHTAAVLSQCKMDDVYTTALQSFGKNLGLAFQLTDDVLDYSGITGKTGKTPGTDLKEGKVTLPLIYIMQHGDQHQKKIVREAIEENKMPGVNDVISLVKSSGGIEYTLNVANEMATLALKSLEHLPESPYKESMALLTRFAIDREL